MVKQRDARYCNIKLLLIFLVIYGHLIEPFIESSAVLMLQYKLIYFFHMPLFCYLTGLFVKSEKAAVNQLKRTMILYLILQLPTVIFKRGGTGLWTPNWVLWYLLSCFFWAVLAFLWYRFGKRKVTFIILAISLLVGCAAGCFDFIGREFSLSRTLVFFPYYFLGMITNSRFPWEKGRKLALPALAVSAVMIVLLWSHISPKFLYHADPFGDVKYGFALRLACYVVGMLISFSLLALTPMKKLPFSVMGADTLWPYIVHWPLATMMKNVVLPWPLYLLISGVVIVVVYFAAKLLGSRYQVTDTPKQTEKSPIFR